MLGAAVFDLNHPAHTVNWEFIHLSVANVVVIGLMLIVFALAIALPFPGAARRARARAAANPNRTAGIDGPGSQPGAMRPPEGAS